MVLITTAHKDVDYAMVQKNAKVIFDTKNAMKAVGEKENWQMISYPGLTHAFTAGQKAEGSAVYSRSGRVEAQVIQDIADFVVRTGTNP